MEPFDYIKLISCVAALMSLGVVLLVNYQNRRSTAYLKLSDQLNEILKISMQYPFLEDEEFIKSYHLKPNPDLKSDDKNRYELYCIMVFNFIERLFTYYGGNERRMNNFMYFPEWAKQHGQWYKANHSMSQTVNSGYGTKFDTFIRPFLQ